MHSLHNLNNRLYQSHQQTFIWALSSAEWSHRILGSIHSVMLTCLCVSGDCTTGVEWRRGVATIAHAAKLLYLTTHCNELTLDP